MDPRRDTPTGRLGRAGRVARAALAGRRGDGAAMAELLGGLRGLPSKLGQALSYVDGLGALDEGARAALGGLLQAAPRSSPEAARGAVESALGAPIDRLFARWEDEPFASASIGQVHRAWLQDGRALAVKVRHPGIAEAIEADLANISALERLAAVAGARRLGASGVVGEIAARLREELDYPGEAARQERFRRFHAGDAQIVVPAVVPERTGAGVLSAELHTGLDLEAASRAPEADRAAWSATLWRFVYRGTTVAGWFNADPHPGNYLFEPDGRVVFLDFGCVTTVPEAQRLADVALHRAALCRDEAAFTAAARRLLPPGSEAQARRVRAQLRRMYEPLFDSPFRITRPWAAGLLTDLIARGREARASGEVLPPPPPGTALMSRLQLGFASVLARLEAEVDYASVERVFLP